MNFYQFTRPTRGDKISHCTLLAFISLVLAATPAIATDKCGAVCDETWTVAASPYVVTCDVTVATGCTLTIDADVEVRAQSGTALQISGSLDVNGTSGSEVLLTSDAAVPAKGDWAGVRLLTGSTGTLDYATVSWAENGVTVHSSGASGTLNHVTASNNNLGFYVYSNATATLTDVTATSNVNGLYVFRGNATQVDVSGGSFTGNEQYGVWVDGYLDTAPSVTISGASIHSNLGGYDFYAYRYVDPSRHTVRARGNWWGTADPAAIGPRIYDHRVSGASPMVDWCAYLDGPGVAAPDLECPDLGICDETVTWNVTSRPYQLTSDLIVCPTGTLEIGPGVEVRTVVTTPEPDFEVSGTLDVNGTSGSEVLLTSDAAVPAKGDWAGVRLLTGSTGTLDYATVSWAENGVTVHSSGASGTLDHVTASNNNLGFYVYSNATATLTDVTATSNVNGLYVFRGNATQVDVSGGSFTGNEQYGVWVDGYLDTAPSVTISGASIHSNLGGYDFYAYRYVDPSRHTVRAQGNWWGTADPAAIGPRIYDHRVSGASPMVDWCAYLDGPGVAAPDLECPDLGICDETVTWNVTSRPYQLTSDLIVCPTGTLEIGPGVEVRTVVTTPEPDFEVSGTLDVNGTSGSGVVLTSDAASPEKDDWRGIRLRAGSTGTFDYATISRAFYGVWVHDAGTSATFDHVTLSHNTRGAYVYGNATATLTEVTASSNVDGLYVYWGAATQVDVSGGSFSGNEQYGLLVDGSLTSAPSVTISGASIHSNLGGYDFYAKNFVDPSRHVVRARGNWWGTADPAAIGPRIYDHRGSGNNPIVDWCAYLDGPEGTERDVECPDLAICDETATWSEGSRPYLLTSDLIVCPTGTLEIDPGVEVRTVVTSPVPYFKVEGDLDVNGTSESEVLLTSDAETPSTVDWRGVRLLAGSTGTLDHARVSWANIGVFVDGSGVSATLRQVTATDNYDGLYVAGGNGTQVGVSGGNFTGNERYGVRVHGAGEIPAVTVCGASIHSNLGLHDLYTGSYENPASTLVWAPDNWWGTTSRDRIRQRIYDHSDNAGSPTVWFEPFGPSCEIALGGDADGDAHGDFEDNCPAAGNHTQADTDADGMGDACDPQPGVQPVAPCNGIDDALDGYADADADGWGDPCDFQPTHDDCYPGAPEICDGRDNDGDGLFGFDELADVDRDGAIACSDCDDLEPEVFPCACESCINTREDDCDGLMDAADPDCFANPYCVVVTAGVPEPGVHVDKSTCGGATLSGPFDVIRGLVSQLDIAGGSVDLGNVACVVGSHAWDRVTDLSVDANPACNDMVSFYLARDTGAGDFGAAYPTGEPRDTMNPDPVCP